MAPEDKDAQREDLPEVSLGGSPTPPGGSSDGEGGERPVREKLKKTSIAGLSQHSKATQADAHPLVESTSAENDQTGSFEAETTNAAGRGRPARKRSFDDLQHDDTTTQSENGAVPLPIAGHHKRMRSRELSDNQPWVAHQKMETDHASPVQEECDVETQKSPGMETDHPSSLQEESDIEAQKSPGGPGVLVDAPARDATPPSEDVGPAEADPISDSVIIGPKKKRSRDQFDKDAHSVLPAPKKSEKPAAEETETLVEPEAIVPEPAAQEDGNYNQDPVSKATVKPSSGFANVSSASPFGSVTSPKSPERLFGQTFDGEEVKSTSSSAFASSGLSAFSSSEKSPFGALGTAQLTGGFGSVAAAGGFGSANGQFGASPFATKSPFGGLGGGFGPSTGFASGFGGTKPLGRGLSTFAGSEGPGNSFGGGKPARAFGAPTEEAEDNSDEDNNPEDGTEDTDDRPRDKRFHEQEVETGEENESTVFSCRAKLYHFDAKEWKERGVGTLKVNVHVASDKIDARSTPPEKKARLIMRTDGVHRVVLNTPIFKGMKVGPADGGEPTGKTLNLTGMESGEMKLFLLRIGKDDVVKELWRRVVDFQAAAA